MKVLINGASSRGGGGETFLLGLLPALLSLADGIEYVLLVPATRASLYAPLVEAGLILRRVPSATVESGLRRLAFEHLAVARTLREGQFGLHFQADEMLSPIVWMLRVPTVAVFHTTAHMLIPDQLADNPLRLCYLRLMKSLAMRLASVPVTVSFHAKAELSGLYPFAHQRIQVVYHGIDHQVFGPAGSRASSPLSHLGVDRYLLSVSDRYAHKNYPRLIRAFRLLCEADRVPEHLVLAGRVKDLREEQRISEAIHSCRLEGRVHLLDYLERARLPALYRGARAYAFPSTFETFGFTPLEAMACGVPVACARFSAMPEVCGDAVEYFDPLDVESIAEALRAILTNQHRRRELVHLGMQRARSYTWRRAAQQYRRLIDRIAGRRQPSRSNRSRDSGIAPSQPGR